MDQFLAVSLLDSCIGWLGALTLIVVGGLVGRTADTGAGLVIAAAGCLKLLLNCCVLTPNLAYQFSGYDLDPSLFEANLVFIQLQRLAFFGLLAVALTRLGNGSRPRHFCCDWSVRV